MRIWDIAFWFALGLDIVTIALGAFRIISLVLAFIIVVSILIIIQLTRIERVQSFIRQNHKRAIAIVLVVVAFGFFVAAFTSVSTPNDEWNIWQNATSYPTQPGYPAADFNLAITFTASGSLSVNNPIHVHALIFDVNITHFLAYYNQIGFIEAYAQGAKPNSQNILPTATLPIKQVNTSGNGTYSVDGTLIWLASGPSYFFLAPKGINGYTIQDVPTFESHVNGTTFSSITIQPISDTLSTTYNDTTLRLTYILVGFSVLMLQPVLEAIVPDRSHVETKQ